MDTVPIPSYHVCRLSGSIVQQPITGLVQLVLLQFPPYYTLGVFRHKRHLLLNAASSALGIYMRNPHISTATLLKCVFMTTSRVCMAALLQFKHLDHSLQLNSWLAQ